MFGQNAQGEVFLRVFAVGSFGYFRGFVYEAGHFVYLEYGAGFLEDHQQPFQARAGIYARLRQRVSPVLALFVLHEHQVPELHIAVFAESVQTCCFGWAGIVFSLICWDSVEKEFRARAARTEFAHAPIVVFV